MRKFFLLLNCLFFLFNYSQSKSFPISYKGFEINYGQITSFDGQKVNDIVFFSKENGYSIFFKTDGFSYVIYQSENGDILSGANQNLNEWDKIKNSKLHYARIDIDLLNSNIAKTNVICDEELPGYSNYYLAQCPEGILYVKSYNKIRVKEVYQGIDLIFKYDHQGVLHYEFEVNKGADVNQIKFRVRWADVRLSSDGREMILFTPLGEIKDGRIVSYEGINEVDIRYRINENGIIGYEVMNWSGNDKLIIDPPLALVWATFYGGSGIDYARTLTTDSSGNLFVTGLTTSVNFPLQYPGIGPYFQGTIGGEGYYDAFILKFSNSGVRQWATYYGGNVNDYGYSITTDATGNVFVVGITLSNNFPLQDAGGGAYYQSSNGGNEDVFILKFTNTGVRQWATYYGGVGTDYGTSIATDASGNVFLTGYTYSTSFPLFNPGGSVYYQGTFGGWSDVFLLKFTNSGVRLLATYYGGNGGDYGNCLTTDVTGNVFMTGKTESLNFPLQNPGSGAYFQNSSGGLNDAFILKFTNSCTRIWATYYGGDSNDYGTYLATDVSENVFITGYTSTANFPVFNPGSGAYYQGVKSGREDAFILKFSNTGVRQWATYYGGSHNEKDLFISTDSSGNIFLTGTTLSTDFPLYNPGSGAYFQGTIGATGYDDAFILKFSNSGIRQWATYYGGNHIDLGFSINTDCSGNIFVAGITHSTYLPLYNPGGGAYFQSTYGGDYYDAFILKFGSSSIGIKSLGNQIPTEFSLNQNYPNPFNPVTHISFSIPKSEYVKLTVYNALGKEIEKLISSYLQAGTYQTSWNASNYPSGIYFYRLEAGNFTRTFKMVLVK